MPSTLMLIPLLSLSITFISLALEGASASPLFLINNITAARSTRSTVEVAGQIAWEIERIGCKYANVKFPGLGKTKVVVTQNDPANWSKIHRKAGVKTKRGNHDRALPARANFSRIAPIVDVAIGHPQQVVRMLLDTGSGVILTTVKNKNAACTGGGPVCGDTIPRFDPNRSTSLQRMPGPFHGNVGKDVIQFLGAGLGGFGFGMIQTVERDNFWTMQISGFLGANVETLIDHDALGEPPLISLFKNKGLNKNALSISFPEGRPATTVLGDIPAQSEIQWHERWMWRKM